MNKAGAVKEPPGFLSVFLLKNGIKIQKGQKKVLKQKIREKTRYNERLRVRMRKIFEFFCSQLLFHDSDKKIVDICRFLHYILF